MQYLDVKMTNIPALAVRPVRVPVPAALAVRHQVLVGFPAFRTVRPVRVPVPVLVPVAAALAVPHQVSAPVPAADWIDQTVKKFKVSHCYLNTFPADGIAKGFYSIHNYIVPSRWDG